MLDVGPMHDGSLSQIQESRLHDLADWMLVNSEGMLFYTYFRDNVSLYATLLAWVCSMVA